MGCESSVHVGPGGGQHSPSGHRVPDSLVNLAGTEFRSLPLRRWSVSHVIQWCIEELGEVLDGESDLSAPHPYTEELVGLILENRICGALLMYLQDEEKLRRQLPLEQGERWATRAQFVADAIASLVHSHADNPCRAAEEEKHTSTTLPVVQHTTAPPPPNATKVQSEHVSSNYGAGPSSNNSSKLFAVISYSTAQTAFKDSLSLVIKEKLGIEAWSGRDVVPGAGGGHWAEQILIIFILSRAWGEKSGTRTYMNDFNQQED
eukprot:gene14769-20819_t